MDKLLIIVLACRLIQSRSSLLCIDERADKRYLKNSSIQQRELESDHIPTFALPKLPKPSIKPYFAYGPYIQMLTLNPFQYPEARVIEDTHGAGQQNISCVDFHLLSGYFVIGRKTVLVAGCWSKALPFRSPKMKPDRLPWVWRPLHQQKNME